LSDTLNAPHFCEDQEAHGNHKTTKNTENKEQETTKNKRQQRTSNSDKQEITKNNNKNAPHFWVI
jgi:hypothetical protein